MAHSGPPVTKTFDSSFLMIVFVVFMKNIDAGDWKKMTAAVAKQAQQFWSCNANFSVFIDRIRNQFLKKRLMIMILNLHSMTKLSGWLRYWTAVSSFLSLEPKTLDCNFFVINYVVLMKNFDHIIGRILRPCGSFWPPCDQNI